MANTRNQLDDVLYPLPEDWDWRRLADLGEIITGTTPSTQEKSYYNGDIPFKSPASYVYRQEKHQGIRQTL